MKQGPVNLPHYLLWSLPRLPRGQHYDSVKFNRTLNISVDLRMVSYILTFYIINFKIDFETNNQFIKRQKTFTL